MDYFYSTVGNYGHLIEVGESSKAIIKRFMDSGMTLEEIADIWKTPVVDMKNSLNP